MKTPLILASGSAIRAKILAGAGLDFTIARPGVDEDAIKRDAAGENLPLDRLALRLAEAKALAVEAPPDAVVLGSDQILEFEGRAYDKPADMKAARARLLDMQGAAHTLINAVAVARGGEIVFRHVDRPRLSMRALDGAQVDAYLAAAGEDILSSVGAYQVEGPGARLFERIDGDYFAVLGLSLFPLLAFLRRDAGLEF